MIGQSSSAVASAVADLVSTEDVNLILRNIKGLQEQYLALTAPSPPDPADNIKTNDESGIAYEKYFAISNALASIQTANNIGSPINFYIKDGNYLTLLLSSERNLLVGAPYRMRPEALLAITEGNPQSTGIYNDKDGSWISAFAAIRISSGPSRWVIIEVTNNIDIYLNRLRRELLLIALICFLVLSASALLGYQLVNRISSDIVKLDGIASQLDNENYKVDIDIYSQDEIGHLARTFKTLSSSIRHKIEELRKSLYKEKRAHLDSIIALTNAAELRDPYTRHHLFRVDKYAMLIAKALRLPKGEIEKLRYGCYLHDIGKIYIEDHIFKKVGLSESERAKVRKHSEDGAKIIEGIPFLQEAKDVILFHQERYDGKGYPNGLKGNEIPLLARIVAVADAFDAMTTDRPYKSKVGFDEAMETLKRNSGTQFDPIVVDAFLKYRKKIATIAKKHF